MRLSFASLRPASALLLCLTTWAAWLPVSAQTNAPAGRPTGNGVITGRVSVGEKPAMGVVVGLMNGQTFNVSDNGAVVKATTDAEGRYRLNQVPAGSFRVAALAPGYVQANEGGFVFEQGKAVNLREGETIENMDFTLARGGVITGKVMDPAGKPLIEERLSVWQVDAQGRKTPWNPPGSVFSSLQTDDRGLYRIYGLAEGRYLLAAGTGGADNVIVTRVSGTSYKRTFYPDTIEEAQAKTIEVTAGGEVKDIDIRLVADTVKGFGVLARIVDAETGAPVPNVRVGYSPLRDGRNFAGMSMAIADAQGIVRLDGLPSGRYSLSITNLGGGGTSSDYFSDPTIFEILDSDVDMVEVRAKRGATISGVAVLEGVADPAIQAKLGELLVSAFSRSSTPSISGMPILSSGFKINRDGSFRLGGLQPGKVQFNLTNIGRGPTGFTLARVELDGVPQRDGFEVVAGQQITTVRLVFVYGQGIVRGQIQIVGGQLPEGARMSVVARRTDAPGGGISGSPAQVDARGQFLIQGLAAGEYELTLNASPRMAVTMTMTSATSSNPGAPNPTGATIITSTTVPPPPPSGTTTTGAPAFAPKTVKQKVMVPGTGEVPVAMTLDLTPAPAPRGN